MSVELYTALCGWLLSLGTHRGIFAHLYLVLTWNLACRSNSTCNIKLSDIVWSTSFDSFHIMFRHSKTDPTGNDARYPRHIFANPDNPVVCPVLALGLYFTCCFSTDGLNPNTFLFPGGKQERRFSDIFGKELEVHELEVRNLGFEVSRLGPHSIRKGASSFLVSLPGGPPAAATSLRGGWSMGGVKDRYWQYMETGDQFVGRCLSLLPIMSVMFASSPPFFDVEPGSDDDDWINRTVLNQFRAVSHVVGFGRLCRMCLATLIHSKTWMVQYLNPNHIVFSDSHVFKDQEATTKLVNNPKLVVVTFPWNDTKHIFSGIPPHASLLQQMHELRTTQLDIVTSFVDRVREALTTHGYGPNRLTDDSLRTILCEFQQELSIQVQRVIRIGDGEVERGRELLVERVENNRSYKLHYFGGAWHRVHSDWRFPIRSNTMNLWRLWWMGNDQDQVPPLSHIDWIDVKHLDLIPLSEFEQNGRPGKNAAVRRKSCKDLCDMRYLMRLMTALVVEENAMEDIISVSSVDRMFSKVAHKLVVGARSAQKTWTTVVAETRRRKNAVLPMVIDA